MGNESLPGTLRVRGLQHGYSSGGIQVPVLQGIELEIAGGEFVAILGPSGCGKTTLLNLLGGLEKADRGTIEIGNTRLTDLDSAGLTRYRSRGVSFIFQFFNLIPNLTAAENVSLGLEPLRLPQKTAAQRIAEYLDAVGLSGKRQRFPSELSGGEQQRVAIARALARESGLILADEPTGNLDRASAESVMDLLTGISRLRTASIVMISHDPKVAARSDRMLRMSDGRLESA